MEGIFGGYLRQSTAVTVMLGPYVDATDGYTPETSLSIDDQDVKVSKMGSSYTGKNETTDPIHNALGAYECELDTTDTNTRGRLSIITDVSGVRPIRVDFEVLDPMTYDLWHTDGTGVTLKLKQLLAVNSGAPGIVGECTSGDFPGIHGIGFGTEAGIKGEASGNAPGIHGQGGPCGGHGILGEAIYGSYDGLRGQGHGSGNGITGATEPAAGGHGIFGLGNLDGIRGESMSNGDGIRGVAGHNTGNAGIHGQARIEGGGAECHGILCDGGGDTGGNPTGGSGFKSTGYRSGDGMELNKGATTGKDLDADQTDELTTAIPELGVGVPAATPTLINAVMLLYMALRNERTQSATEMTVANDAGTTIAKKGTSATPTVLTADKMISG